ncbi:MAG: transporter substrate-binding domain-containing protein [Thermoanaerobaculia bacterium]
MKAWLATVWMLCGGSVLGAQPPDPVAELDDRLELVFHGDLPEIRERGFIRVLVGYNRTHFFITGDGPQGFEYELLKEYEKSLQKRAEGRFEMVFLPVPVDRLLADLEAGRGEIAAAGLTITPERLERVAFTDPYLSNVDEIVVTGGATAGGAGAGLDSLDDLAGRVVHVVKGSSYAEHLRSLSAGLEARGLPAIAVEEAPAMLQSEDLLELTHAGIIDLMVVDRHVAELWSSVLPNLVLRDDLAVHRGGRIAWAVRKQDRELRADLDRFVADHRKGTLLGNIFFKRYFKNTRWVESPTDAEQRRFLELRGLFQKYGERYGFDWLVLAALAFQESRFDQSVQSSAGAVGVMQIKPSTAADTSVGIPDVYGLENNVHAGVKYLDWLRKHFFNDPGISPAAKVDFTLAAYNAGPGRVRGLRRRAPDQGYDPNRWFYNVERVALQEVGWETVRYVANINKYYFAFKLAEQAAKERKEHVERLSDQ